VTNLTFRDCKELIALCSSPGPLSKAELTDEELELAVAMRNRIWEVAEEARNLKVRVMIDAEQTYFQPAIDNFVLELQREYNGEFPTIFNTYQCYLKDSFTRCEFALKRYINPHQKSIRFSFFLPSFLSLIPLFFLTFFITVPFPPPPNTVFLEE
jgi:hypothetical protein